ncbi:MAG: hypothetical protein WBX06_14135 [Acidobacteriaceae bacterium]
MVSKFGSGAAMGTTVAANNSADRLTDVGASEIVAGRFGTTEDSCDIDRFVWGFFAPPETIAGFPGIALAPVDAFGADRFPSSGTKEDFPGEATGSVDEFDADSFPSPGRTADFAGGTTGDGTESGSELLGPPNTVAPETAGVFPSAVFSPFNCGEEGLAPMVTGVKPEPAHRRETEDLAPSEASHSESARSALPDEELRDAGGEIVSLMAAGLTLSFRACIASWEDPAAACEPSSRLVAAEDLIAVAFG